MYIYIKICVYIACITYYNTQNEKYCLCIDTYIASDKRLEVNFYCYPIYTI